MSDPPAMSTPTIPPPTGFAGRALAELADGEPRSAEQLAQQLSADIDHVLASLLQLELDGWVRRLPGPHYASTQPSRPTAQIDA